MSLGPFCIKRNDLGPSLEYICALSDKSIVDLSAASGVTFAMRRAGSRSAAPKVNAAAVIVDAVNGIIRYDWQAGDTDTAGEFEAEFQVTFPTHSPVTFPGGDYIGINVLTDIAT